MSEAASCGGLDVVLVLASGRLEEKRKRGNIEGDDGFFFNRSRSILTMFSAMHRQATGARSYSVMATRVRAGWFLCSSGPDPLVPGVLKSLEPLVRRALEMLRPRR